MATTMSPNTGFSYAYGQMEYERLKYEYEKRFQEMRYYYEKRIYQQMPQVAYSTQAYEQEIRKLKDELVEKKTKKANDLRNLIAYYYKR